MNCLSEYPKFTFKFRVISKMVEEFPGTIIIYNDHSQTNFTSIIVVASGAKLSKSNTLSPFITAPTKMFQFQLSK